MQRNYKNKIERFISMKTKIIKRVHPKSKVKFEDKEYICESCGYSTIFESAINKCYCCGNDVCTHCGSKIKIVMSHINSLGINTSIEEVTLCKDCYKKVMKDKQKYEQSLQKVLDECNSKIQNLCQNYLTGAQYEK